METAATHCLLSGIELRDAATEAPRFYEQRRSHAVLDCTVYLKCILNLTAHRRRPSKQVHKVVTVLDRAVNTPAARRQHITTMLFTVHV